jgi:hypothetical protein
LQFSQFFTAQGASPLVSLVHAEPEFTAAGAFAAATAAPIVGATISSFSNKPIIIYRCFLLQRRLVLIYLLLGKLLQVLCLLDLDQGCLLLLALFR